MVKTKGQMYMIIGSCLFLILLCTVTYAFFNYTKIGSVNTSTPSDITFNNNQEN